MVEFVEVSCKSFSTETHIERRLGLVFLGGAIKKPSSLEVILTGVLAGKTDVLWMIQVAFSN